MSTKKPQESLVMIVELCAQGERRMELVNNESICPYMFCDCIWYPCCYLVTQSCPTLCDPMDCSMLCYPVLNDLPEFAQTHVHWVSDAIQPSHPLLPPSSPALNIKRPSISVFSDESALCIRWPKYCSLCFSLSPSNEYSGSISFRIDWFDLLVILLCKDKWYSRNDQAEMGVLWDM